MRATKPTPTFYTLTWQHLHHIEARAKKKAGKKKKKKKRRENKRGLKTTQRGRKPHSRP
jgi:hypothetical protein